MDQIVNLCRIESWLVMVVVIAASVFSVAIGFYVNMRVIGLLYGFSKSSVPPRLVNFFNDGWYPMVHSVLERLPQKTVDLLRRVLTDKYCSLEMQQQLSNDLHVEIDRLLAKFRVSFAVFIPFALAVPAFLGLAVINLSQAPTLVVLISDIVMVLSAVMTIRLFTLLLDSYRQWQYHREQLEHGVHTLYTRLDL